MVVFYQKNTNIEINSHDTGIMDWPSADLLSKLSALDIEKPISLNQSMVATALLAQFWLQVRCSEQELFHPYSHFHGVLVEYRKKIQFNTIPVGRTCHKSPVLVKPVQ